MYVNTQQVSHVHLLNLKQYKSINVRVCSNFAERIQIVESQVVKLENSVGCYNIIFTLTMYGFYRVVKISRVENMYTVFNKRKI